MLETITSLIGIATGGIAVVQGAMGVTKEVNEMLDRPGVDVSGPKKLIMELQERLIQLQADYSTMKSALLDIQDEQRRIDRFEAEASRYFLAENERGAFVYKLDQAEARGDPTHCLCACCFQNRVKAILQPSADGGNFLSCPVCHTKIPAAVKSDDGGVRFARTRHPDFDGYI